MADDRRSAKKRGISSYFLLWKYFYFAYEDIFTSNCTIFERSCILKIIPTRELSRAMVVPSNGFLIAKYLG